MIKSECTQCGKTVIASTINDGVCLSCGRPEDSKVTSSRGDIAGVSNSSTTAITTLNGLAVVVLMFSMLCGLVVVVLGGQSGIGGAYLVIAGISIAVIGLVQWAFIKVFVGIAEDIKAIREKV